MSDTTKIYHNPRCSKSRATLGALEERGIKPEIILYLEKPPSVKEIKTILTLLGVGPRAIMRKGEEAYKQLNLGDESLSDAALVKAIHENPKLLERPIVVVKGKRAAIGRPLENVLEIVE